MKLTRKVWNPNRDMKIWKSRKVSKLQRLVVSVWGEESGPHDSEDADSIQILKKQFENNKEISLVCIAGKILPRIL